MFAHQVFRGRDLRLFVAAWLGFLGFFFAGFLGRRFLQRRCFAKQRDADRAGSSEQNGFTQQLTTAGIECHKNLAFRSEVWGVVLYVAQFTPAVARV
jgi:hypothetical protein